MYPTSPRSFQFSEPSSPKRPASRASSTTTEVPANRSLPREIDHIKSLIARFTSGTKQNDTSISAWIFRSTVPQEDITQAHILAELDALKRRIRIEATPLPRRRPEDDPETPSEADDGEYFDERDEQLDSFQAEVNKREQWLEHAENRVDKVTEEKEKLEKLLQECREAHKTSKARVEELSQQQKEHTATIKQLKAAHADQFKLTRDTHIKNLERERDLATRNAEDKDGYVESLESELIEVKKDIADVQAEREELEREHVRSLQDLKEQHDKVLQESQRQASQELARARREAVQTAEAQRQQHETLLQQQAAMHSEVLTAEKDRYEAEHAGHAAKWQEENVKQMEELHAAHAIELGKRRDSHQDKLDQVVSDHDKMLQELRTGHEERCRRLRKELEDKHDELHARLENATKLHEDNISSQRREADEMFDRERQEHAKEVQRLQAEREMALKAATDGVEDKSHTLIAELDERHEGERREWSEKIAAMEREYSEKMQQIEQSGTAEVASMQNKHDAQIDDYSKQLESLREEHDKVLHRTKEEYAIEKRTMIAEHKKKNEDIESKYAEEMTTLKTTHQTMLDDSEAKVQKALNDALNRSRELEVKHVAKLQDVHAAHDQAIAAKVREHNETIEALKSAHQSSLEEVSRSNLDLVSSMQIKHQEVLSQMQGQVESVQQDMAQMKIKSTDAHDQSKQYQEQLSQLRVQFNDLQASTTELAKQSELELTLRHEEKIKALQAEWTAQSKLTADEHESKLAKAIQEATAHAEMAGADARQALHDSLQDTKVHDAHQHELKTVESRHSDEISKLSAELKAVQEELARSREDYQSLSSLHAAEVARLFNGSKSDTASVSIDKALSTSTNQSDAAQAREGAKGQTTEATSVDDDASNGKSPEQASTDNAMTNKAHQWQIASLTRQLEENRTARISAEEMLQLKMHDSIQADEEKRQEARKLAAAQQELSALRKEHERTVHSLGELQETVLEHEHVSSDAARSMLEDLNDLKEQIDAAQRERSAVQSDIDSKSTERSELASQNDFLSKQLADLGSHMHRPKKIKYESRGMQTSSRIEVVGGSPRRSVHRRNVSLSNDPASPTTRSNRNSIIFGPELHADTASSPLAKNAGERPVTPLTSIKQDADIKASPDVKARRRTFQDYLQRAETELYEIGSVVTANEAFFARKIREHVGDLQKSKDALAQDYQRRFDDLLAEKTRQDKQETLDISAEFVREREILAAKFIQTEHSGVPSSHADILKASEEKLVHKYNQRIAKRKSQIRLKHAQEFHNLTEAYDQELSGLLWPSPLLDEDQKSFSSIGSAQINVRPEPIRKASASKLPQRSASALVSSRTIRADKPKLVDISQDGRATTQRSASLRQSTEDSVRRNVTSPLTQHTSINGSAQDDYDQDVPLSLAASTQHMRSVRRQSAIPNMQASRGESTVDSDVKKDKSKRHSSGLFYNKMRLK